MTYIEYLGMEYLDEYKNLDNFLLIKPNNIFDLSYKYNDIQFIALLIALIILCFYPMTIIIIYYPGQQKKDENEKEPNYDDEFGNDENETNKNYLTAELSVENSKAINDETDTPT
jgi:hypothetical protein